MQAQTEIESWLSSFSSSFGADTLHTGRIRSLRLEIGQDEHDLQEGQGHALIVGLPSPDEDPKTAEDLATALRNLSRAVDRNRRKR